MPGRKILITGSCQCGNVRYTLQREPYFTAICHCKDCQKLSSSAFSITSYVRAEDVRIEGELKHYQRGAESGNVVDCYFCPTCGNRIYHRNPHDPDVLRLKGAFDDSAVLKPLIQVWTRSRHRWLRGLHGLAEFPTQTLERKIVVRAIVFARIRRAALFVLRATSYVCTALVAAYLFLG